MFFRGGKSSIFPPPPPFFFGTLSLFLHIPCCWQGCSWYLGYHLSCELSLKPAGRNQLSCSMWNSFFSELPLVSCTPPLAGWNELLIASFSHRSVSVQDGILLATGLHVHRSSAHSAGVGSIFDRYVACFCYPLAATAGLALSFPSEWETYP